MCTQTWSTIWPELVKGLPAAFVALVIGCIATYVAWRQYKVSHSKLNLDLFQQRYEIYDAVWDFLTEANTKAKQQRTASMTGAFLNFIPKAHFLFGQQIGNYMEKIRDEVAAMDIANTQLQIYEQLSEPWEEAKRVSLRTTKYIEQEIKVLRVRFGPYMNFEQWK